MGRRKNKKGDAPLPPPPGAAALPPPPPGAMPIPPLIPPAGAAPLPPPPGAAPLPPPPGAAPLSPPGAAPLPPPGMDPLPPPPSADKTVEAGPPTPPPMGAVNSEKPELPPPSAVSEAGKTEDKSDDSTYSNLYAKKSGKSLQQIYGHIDRIAQGEIGSLLDRYSDRFGHELDRDIIVMRKNERSELLSEMRDSPVVELINSEEEKPEESNDLSDQLKIIEDELRRLKPEFQAAKESGDKETMLEMRPILKELMAERKMLQQTITGETPVEDKVATVPAASVAEVAEEDVSDDVFVTFVAIVDDLLGNHLPDDVVSEFMESEDFETYRIVGGDPSSADDNLRSKFFGIVDSRLGKMPDEAVSTFLASPEFETYRAVGEIYS